MKNRQRPSPRATRLVAAAIALTAVPFVGGCQGPVLANPVLSYGNSLPYQQLPKDDAQSALPRWYPERPWSAREGESRIYIEGKIVFDSDKDTIRPGTSDKVLMTLLQFVNEHPEVTLVRIEGHTDDRASDEHNMDLSARRALKVCDWLVDHGVDYTRLLAVGFGKTRPIAPNSNAAGMQENRRTEFHVAEVNGRPFVNKDAANGGYALIVKSAEQRKAEREAALHPPQQPKLKAFVPEGDVVKPVDVNKVLRAQAREREKKEKQQNAPGGGDDGT